ncbi:DUF4256 domain-containing protein [Flavobacterium sp. WC2509]|uniref:DUF4256 domain-containing protein n=1 Tax=Flavobacterium sp. WC2509 TaxID=3461406 RepID=UPI004043B42D
MGAKKELLEKKKIELLKILKDRFEKNSDRHKNLEWKNIQVKLEANSEKLWVLNEMEETGGEPDVVGYDNKIDEYIFFDCSVESPSGRRSYCYDRKALDARKANKPTDSVVEVAARMGVELLSEEQYRDLQQLGKFDNKTSSWIATPADIRNLGGAIFADYRYGTVFIYHNGADSYYAARGFRGSLRV